MINEHSKQVQKEYKTRNDWAGKVIHWELYKRLNFERITKCHMHKSESVKKNETLDFTVFWDKKGAT